MSDSQDVIDKLTYGDLQPNNWCRFGWHKWSRWVIVHEGQYADSKRTYYDIKSTCKQCGMPRSKEIVQKQVK